MAVRRQRTREAIAQVARIEAKLPFYRKHHYVARLPISLTISQRGKRPSKSFLARNVARELEGIDFAALEERVVDALESIREGMAMLSGALPRRFFSVRKQYTAIFGPYGVGGSYDHLRSVVMVKVGLDSETTRPIAHILLHEMVHIGIEAKLVNRYCLSHGQKEMLVDLICSKLLGLVGYKPRFPTSRLVQNMVRRLGWYRLDEVAHYMQSQGDV